MTYLTWLEPSDQPIFPDTEMALDDPQGLLAAGGCLNEAWLLHAYERGIFPWFGEGEPIMWWAPTPRMVLIPGNAHISRSLRKLFRKSDIMISVNQQFETVIRQCANGKLRSDGTWITEHMIQAYVDLHKLGWAHSIEVNMDGNLVGGLYGLGIDRCFFGESMFSISPSASKFAFLALDSWARDHLDMIDCQLHNPYLESMGARLIPKATFKGLLPKQRIRLCLSEQSNLTSLLQQRMVVNYNE